MSDFIPDAQFVPDAHQASSPAPASTPVTDSSDFIPDDKFQDDESRYGGIGGQALAGIAGLARGLTLGGSDYALTHLGAGSALPA